MKNKYLIIALTVFSFFAGITNIQAQDTTLKLSDYLTKTSWLVGVGPDFLQNDGKSKIPLIFDPFKNYSPFRLAVEKDIYGFRHWKHTKGWSAVAVFSSTGLHPHNFAALDGYFKYDLNNLIGDTKWFDPYAMIGGGLSFFQIEGKKVKKAYYDKSVNFNLGGGANFWVRKNVGIVIQSVAKFVLLKKTFGGTNYFQHTIGLVFNIGGPAREEVAAVPVSTYKRSKEAEDALIHLREHINK